MSELGPLSLWHWQPLTVGEKGRFVIKNTRRLVTSMLIASQRHQLRPMVNQYLELVTHSSSNFDASDLLAAVDDTLPYFETSELPLDTSSLLVKMLKLFHASFFANLSVETLISRAKSQMQVPLVSFVNVLMAHCIIVSQHPLKLHILNDILFNQQNNSVIRDLKYFVTSRDETLHDEVRIFAFQILIQLVANCAAHCRIITDYIQSDSFSKMSENLLEFVVESALPALCTASTTPSRERFCSLLIGALSTDAPISLFANEKVTYINRVLSKLVSMQFDDSNYAVQRCMLRFFRDLTPLTPNLAISDAVYSKLLNLCRSDFNDVRHQAEQISLDFGEKCLANNQMSVDFVEITKQNMIEAVQAVQMMNGSGNLDNFLPGKSAFLFVHCKSMLMKCKCWDTGCVRLRLIDNSTIVVDFLFDSSKEEDQDGVLLDDITKAVKELLKDFDDSRAFLVLFLLSVGHLIVQSFRRDATFSGPHGDAVQAYFQCCTTVYWRFFGDDSPAFEDRSLGGYELLREHPIWAILLTTAKNLSAFCSLTNVSSKEHNTVRRYAICKVVRRVLFSTLHFGLLEEYSNLLCHAVIAWPETVAPEFETSLCCALFSSEEEDMGENFDQVLELSPGEVRRGGGLPLAFVALFNGLDRIGKIGDMERILRKGILDRFNCETASLSTQTAVFHVLRAAFAFGDARTRVKLADEVGKMALLALKMSAPFQTRNAGIQALSACVHPVISEGICSVWKFSRTFPTLFQTIRLICKMDGEEILAQTAALSILAKLNPLISQNDFDETSVKLIDETFEDDLMKLAISSPVAYVRSAAASALVSIACSDPDVDPVKRASLLLSSIIQFANKWCSGVETNDHKKCNNFLPENGVHGLLLIIDRSISMMQSSWLFSSLGAHQAVVEVIGDQQVPSWCGEIEGVCNVNRVILTHLPATLDRVCPAICATLRRLVKLTNPSATFLQQMLAAYLAKLS